MSIRIGDKIIGTSSIATPNSYGIVKPDNETVTIDENGVLSSQSNDIIFRDWSI